MAIMCLLGKLNLLMSRFVFVCLGVVGDSDENDELPLFDLRVFVDLTNTKKIMILMSMEK